MPSIVLDTNVIVSAGIKQDSIPYRLIEGWALSRRIRVIAYPYVLREYRVVLGRDKFARFGFPPAWLETLMERCEQHPDPLPWPHAMPDPTDTPFLALAHAAGAWLVTGNLKHFPKSSRRGVTVISPADYLHHLTHPE